MVHGGQGSSQSETSPAGLQVGSKTALAVQGAFWRQSELERRLETLDQEEHALHQSQMRLFREQMAVFMHDLELMRQDLSGMEKENSGVLELVNDTREAHTSLDQRHHTVVDRLAALEKAGKDLAERYSKQERMLEGVHDQFHVCAGRLDAIEASIERHSHSMSKLEAVQERHAHGLDGFSAAVGKQSLLLEDVKSKSGSSYESILSLRDLQKKLEQAQVTTTERLSTLERALREHAEQQEVRVKQSEGIYENFSGFARRLGSFTEELEQIKGSQDRQTAGLDSLKAAQRRCTESILELRSGLSEANSATERRLSSVEGMLREPLSRSATFEGTLYVEPEERTCDASVHLTQELASLQAAQTRVETELARFATDEKARTLIQRSLADRVGTLERTVCDKFDKMDTRLSVVRGIWARDREHLLGTCRTDDECSFGGEEAPHKTPCFRGLASESDTSPPLLRSSVQVRKGLRASRSASPRSPCDWDEAIKRMQAEGIVQAGLTRVGRLSDEWR